MRSKKCFIIGVTLAACLFGLQTPLWGQESKDPNEEVKLLQEKIKQLENVVETQQNTISQLNQELDEQTKEIKRLKMLCSKAGVNISPVQDKTSSKDKYENFIKVSPLKLYYFYKAPMRKLQKEEQYRNKYKGQWVQWTGRINSIVDEFDGVLVFTNLREDIFRNGTLEQGITFIVRVYIDKTQKQKLLLLEEGDIVTYQGKLPDSCQNLFSTGLADYDADSDTIHFYGYLSLTDGRIVSP
jgi:hypothetical protein